MRQLTQPKPKTLRVSLQDKSELTVLWNRDHSLGVTSLSWGDHCLEEGVNQDLCTPLGTALPAVAATLHPTTMQGRKQADLVSRYPRRAAVNLDSDPFSFHNLECRLQ